MTWTLPLFPLGTVLYPGLLLPLHIFEERYRQLVHDLMAEPEPRCFGVIAIREGRETGDHEAAQQAAEAVQSGFRAYLEALAARGATHVRTPDLPDEPVQLSYLV